jgi:hypothetical protein
MINQNWVFSEKNGLKFDTNTPKPTPFSGTKIPQVNREGCASISDSNGNLLFYTNGVDVWDSANDVKNPNNQLLGDASSTQSAIIVPVPNNSDEYYIFTTDGSVHNPPFNHFNGVKINVTNWNITELADIMTLPSNDGFSPVEKLTAIPHANCRDFWVITVIQEGSDPDTGNNSNQSQQGIINAPGIFRIFLVDPSGVQHISDIPAGNNIFDSGYLKASSDRKLLGVANSIANDLYVYPFDNASGTITVPNVIKIPIPPDAKAKGMGIYGIEFSPDSKTLYFSVTAYGKIGRLYQADPTGATPANLIKTLPSGGDYGIAALQLGPDGIIYFARPQLEYLGAIENPNVGGASNVKVNHVHLGDDSFCGIGLPNLIASPCEDHDCDCGCGCSGCNEDAEELNAELIERAKQKHNIQSSGSTAPFMENCDVSAVKGNVKLQPNFHFHWGDGPKDEFEEHDTEVFYLTVCNHYEDVQFNGLQITKLNLIPDVEDLNKIQIVPDRFVRFDCLKSCSCQTREFAMITRANDIAGNYELEIEYCFENITIENDNAKEGKVSFSVEIVKD